MTQELSTNLKQQNTTTLPSNILIDPEARKDLWAVADVFFKSGMLPKQYNSVNSCFVAMDLARSFQNCAVLTVLQNIHIIHGKPGLTSTFLASYLQSTGLIKYEIDYEITVDPLQPTVQFKGMSDFPNHSVKAIVVRSRDGKEISTPEPVTLQTAIKEGWATKNGNKYESMPVQMLIYRAVTFLVRAHFPTVINGMHTTDELQDIHTPSMNSSVITDDFNIQAPVNTEVAPVKDKERQQLVDELTNKYGYPVDDNATMEMLREALAGFRSKDLKSDSAEEDAVIVDPTAPPEEKQDDWIFGE